MDFDSHFAGFIHYLWYGLIFWVTLWFLLKIVYGLRFIMNFFEGK